MNYKKSRFYFNQFWACENPEMLRQGKLTALLYHKWNKVWRKFNYYYEDRIYDICKYYKRYILKGNTMGRLL